MKPLQWQPYMALGIAEFDAAHRTFVTALAALHDCPDHQLGAGIAGLRQTLARGFSREEALMEAIGLPGAAEHRTQHQRTLAAFDELAPHNPASGRRVLTLMPRWFLFHLANMDLPLANALHLVQAPRSANHKSGRQPAAVTDCVAG